MFTIALGPRVFAALAAASLSGGARRSVRPLYELAAFFECRKEEHVIDETPMAYKDIDAVMAAQSDLVEVVHTLKQVVCVKG